MPSITWKVLPKVSDDLTTQLLYNRGLKTKKEIEDFIEPKIENYKKDLKIEGIDKAWQRIEQAIKKEELIVVYGDYDVDGICASAILYKGLTSQGAKVLPYIPHRDKEGYGLSKVGLDFARDSGANLVITVDNGIVALEQAKFAKELGLDLIITDHHLPLEILPDAYAIVHSLKMCGAGVAWCLIKERLDKKTADSLLQFVAIATIADMIPLLGLARAFVIEGINQLKRTDNLGLLSLSLEAGVNIKELGSYEIGHILAPRLNAIGRLEHAIDALRLLCTKDPKKARNLAKLLCDTNTARQKLTVDAVEEARVFIRRKASLITENGSKKIYVLDSPNWSSGIIGLIAARVCEEYYRPAIAISVGEKIAKGSARSIDGINIVEVIRECSDLLIDIGGHKGAAGFSLDIKNIPAFKEKIEKLMEDNPEINEKLLEIEAEVESRKLTKALVSELEQFEPFGFGNPRILLASKRLKVSEVRTVGDGKHLKFKADGIDAIAFGQGSYKDLLTPGCLTDLAYYPEVNKFNGTETLQLKVKDIRLSTN